MKLLDPSGKLTALGCEVADAIFGHLCAGGADPEAATVEALALIKAGDPCVEQHLYDVIERRTCEQAAENAPILTVKQALAEAEAPPKPRARRGPSAAFPPPDFDDAPPPRPNPRHFALTHQVIAPTPCSWQRQRRREPGPARRPGTRTAAGSPGRSDPDDPPDAHVARRRRVLRRALGAVG